MGNLPNHHFKDKDSKYYYDPSKPEIWLRRVDGQNTNGLKEGRNGGGSPGKKWFFNPANPVEKGFFLPSEAPECWLQGRNDFKAGGRPRKDSELRSKILELIEQGFSHSEIKEKLGCSTNNISYHRNRDKR